MNGYIRYILFGVVLLIIGVVIFLYFNKNDSSLSLIDGEDEKTTISTSSCFIVEDMYCVGSEIIEKEINGRKISFIGFNLPPGTDIFSPFAGIRTNGEYSDTLNGFFSIVSNTQNPTSRVQFVGDVEFVSTTSGEVKKGDRIGSIGDRGIVNFDDYNLLFLPSLTQSDGVTVTDFEMINSLFGTP